MLYYECYLYRPDGTICGASPFTEADDGEARRVARSILAQRHDAVRCELWQEDREIFLALRTTGRA